MKKITVVVLLTLCFQGFAQKNMMLNKPEVDKRVELLSIIFRLAEKPEYTSTNFKLYTNRIEKHFGKYKDHELIKFTKSIMYKHGIGYDAVMSMAIHIDENQNLSTGIMNSSLDTRWGKNADEFVSLLKKFYKETNCGRFFDDNADLYAEAGIRFLPVYEHLDLNWYQSFYGKESTETFVAVISLGNGSSSYGVSLNDQNNHKKVYAIMGTWLVDDTGLPDYKVKNYFPTMLHEFNHSFVNYLTEKYKNALKNSGEQIFAVLKDEMSSQAYGSWETMMNEALVRACVIKYMKDHDFNTTEIENETTEQINRGSIWIKALVDELNNYSKQRATCLILEDYMPNLVAAYEVYAKEVQEFDHRRPKVVSITEFKNGDKAVSAGIKTITINFDKPLSGKGYSIFLGNKGKTAFPTINKTTYSNNNQSVILDVSLEEDKEYQFVLTGNRFTSIDGTGMKNYEVNFKTGK